MDAPEGSTPVNVPAPFLAEHGRVCMENSELRRALDDAQRHIATLVAEVKRLAEAGTETDAETMLHVVEPDGATPEAS